eukprot:TRINITY_DN8929_c0_g1_i2.p1 TRINITY_DN8929_c0_g1~~TRINITY_DN8929_c0_g1_i2.p1  ORF type:complete len:316 (-),score=88.68 TRINITY_DN8929_c0_g1_i2:722-1669(-)
MKEASAPSSHRDSHVFLSTRNSPPPRKRSAAKSSEASRFDGVDSDDDDPLEGEEQHSRQQDSRMTRHWDTRRRSAFEKQRRRTERGDFKEEEDEVRGFSPKNDDLSPVEVAREQDDEEEDDEELAWNKHRKKQKTEHSIAEKSPKIVSTYSARNQIQQEEEDVEEEEELQPSPPPSPANKYDDAPELLLLSIAKRKKRSRQDYESLIDLQMDEIKDETVQDDLEYRVASLEGENRSLKLALIHEKEKCANLRGSLAAQEREYVKLQQLHESELSDLRISNAELQHENSGLKSQVEFISQQLKTYEKLAKRLGIQK